MNKNELFNAIGGISDELVNEIENPTPVRHFGTGKMGVIAAAIVVLMGMTALAANLAITRRSGHSSNIPDYYSAPTQSQLMEDIGIDPVIVKSFSNGYTFKSGHIVENSNYAEDGSVVESYRSLACWYEKDGGDDVVIYIDGSVAGNQMEKSETVEVYKGSEIKYFSYMNKFVPGDYVLTEQDKADQAAGLVFSYGSPEVRTSQVQTLGWKYGGLNYDFALIDSDLTKNELVQMAKEVIDAQK